MQIDLLLLIVAIFVAVWLILTYMLQYITLKHIVKHILNEQYIRLGAFVEMCISALADIYVNHCSKETQTSTSWTEAYRKYYTLFLMYIFDKSVEESIKLRQCLSAAQTKETQK